MASEGDSGPRFVWTFPLIRRFQSKNSVIDFGQNASTVSNTVESVRESSPVRDKVSDTLTSDEEDESDEAMDELMSEVQQVEEGSESVFGNDYGQEGDSILEGGNTVEMDEDIFVPLRLEIEEGDAVTWENNDDSPHRILSTSGEDIPTDQLEPGETFTHTFDEEGVTRYIDSMVGGDKMCGAIIVGDAELDEPLRCEEDVERELFNEEDGSSTPQRTMSAAVEDKEDMDVGF